MRRLNSLAVTAAAAMLFAVAGCGDAAEPATADGLAQRTVEGMAVE